REALEADGSGLLSVHLHELDLSRGLMLELHLVTETGREPTGEQEGFDLRPRHANGRRLGDAGPEDGDGFAPWPRARPRDVRGGPDPAFGDPGKQSHDARPQPRMLAGLRRGRAELA